MHELLADIRRCTICAAHLPHGPRPVMSASPKSRVVIIGQAPGRIVHASGIPWEDKSGDNLRGWMGVSKDEFYDPDRFALVPMGFCFPGSGRSGDLPPRPECAPQWHVKLLANMPEVMLTLLIGQYAQKYYLKDKAAPTLTATVQHFKDHLPKYFVLPHPSPRNNIWQAKNPWFAKQTLPALKKTIRIALDA